MEINNTSSSDSSMCKKVREALATINNRFSQQHRESQTVAIGIDSDSPSSSPAKTTAIQTKATKLQHPKAQAEVIPIRFDYSTPATRVASPHVRISEKVQKSEKGTGDTEHQGKKDTNFDFSGFIQRARHRIRTVSNVGKGQGEPAPHEANIGYGIKKKDSHREHISNFIHLTRKKIRTASSIRKE